MIYISVRNPQWADAAHTTINCEVIFPSVSADFLPFSAMASGDYPHTGKIFESCVAGDFGTVTEYVAPVIPAPTPAQIIKSLTDAVQAHLDAAARTRGYDDIVSASSYAAAPNPFQAESQAFLVWRAACWTTCYQIMAEVEAGTHAVPSAADLIAALPALVLP